MLLIGVCSAFGVVRGVGKHRICFQVCALSAWQAEGCLCPELWKLRILLRTYAVAAAQLLPLWNMSSILQPLPPP